MDPTSFSVEKTIQIEPRVVNGRSNVSISQGRHVAMINCVVFKQR